MTTNNRLASFFRSGAHIAKRGFDGHTLGCRQLSHRLHAAEASPEPGELRQAVVSLQPVVDVIHALRDTKAN